MTDDGSRAPPGVDPALWAQVDALSERIHDLLRQHRDAPGETQRFVVELPEEWVLLAAWLNVRQRGWMAGKSEPNTLDVQDLASEHWKGFVRGHVREFLARMVSDVMHDQLHLLATGRHAYLRPRPPEPKREPPPDDGIPF